MMSRSSCHRIDAVKAALSGFSLLSILIALILVLPWMPADAQATQGSVVGAVTDSAGAVIPGALVTLTSSEEGTVRVSKTERRGRLPLPRCEGGPL